MKKKKLEKPLACYERRNQRLAELGYLSYHHYLRSVDWKIIKSRILKIRPNCQACGRKANVVHHLCYAFEVLLGYMDNGLASLCHRCHEYIEFDMEGNKLSITQANAKLKRLANSNGQNFYLMDWREWLKNHPRKKRR